jgi:large subunit ribosomal protein L18
MNPGKRKAKRRRRRRRGVRKRVFGVPERPRLTVFRSHKHIFAQIVDDTEGRTLAAASTLSKEARSNLRKKDGKAPGRREAAALVGKLLADRAAAASVTSVIFDRNGYRYHGRVKALADGAREAGLRF